MTQTQTSTSTSARPEPVVLSIGVFDGVHIGHQELLRRTVSAAQNLEVASAALTFAPHPRSVLSDEPDLKYLLPITRRLELIRAQGVQHVILREFDRTLGQLSAYEFFLQLTQSLTLQRLVVGENFRLGRNREAGIAELRTLGASMGWDVQAVPPVELEGQIVTSSRLRQLLADSGDVQLAARLLGRPFELSGPIVQGFGRGRTIGVPTANVQVASELLVPRNGVYLCSVQLDGGPQAQQVGVLNIGIRPTFDSGARSIEVHLVDWSGDLYGRTITLHFLHRLRGEQKFANVDALTGQIGLDIARARELARTFYSA